MAELLSVATAVPEYCVTAADTTDYLSAAFPGVSAQLARMVRASRIRTRHLALPIERLRGLNTLDARNQEYARQAVGLGEKTAREAIDAAGIGPHALSTVIAVSSTGHMMPTLDTHLVNRLGLNPSCRRVPLSDLGCVGGVAAIGLAAEILNGTSARHALVVSVELPSLSLPVGEAATSDAMACLQFGDGAGAIVLSAQNSGRGPSIVATRTFLLPETTDVGGSRLTDTGLRAKPSPWLPSLIRSRLPGLMQEFLQPLRLRPADISFWLIQPRGPQSLETIGDALGLSERTLAPSWTVWERCGNMISSSLFFTLQELQKLAPPPRDTLGVMLAFGAGVTCEMAPAAFTWVAGRRLHSAKLSHVWNCMDGTSPSVATDDAQRASPCAADW